jgi:hypothetical protein
MNILVWVFGCFIFQIQTQQYEQHSFLGMINWKGNGVYGVCLGCFRLKSARSNGREMDIHCVHFGMLQTQISTFGWECDGYPLCAIWDASDSNQHV